MSQLYDGFWLPPAVREAVITSNTDYNSLRFRGGRPVRAGEAAEVTVRWPHLSRSDWQAALACLRQNQQRARGEKWSGRLSAALHRMQGLWGQADSLQDSLLQALSTCTGHSVAMLDFALDLLDLVSVADLERAMASQLPQAIKGEFVALDSLAGRGRFFAESGWRRFVDWALTRFDRYRMRPWRLEPRATDLILGYAAGNVPGTGLLLVLLGLAAAGSGQTAGGLPIVVVRNSRHEPLFTPLVLSALAAVDPALVDTTLVTVWDYGDAELQEYLAGQADLVVAAASDETIESIGQVVARVDGSRSVAYHRHGHKVSFSTVGRECLAVDRIEPEAGVPLVEVVALLASLDVALWNQQGCLSSRVHFVEQGAGPGYHRPEVYGRAVVQSLRTLDDWLPRGVSRQRHIHNLFDKYQTIAAAGEVEVLSDYDDGFLVILDKRPLTPRQFQEVVNDCQGRTVSIVPVADVLDVPGQYLRHVRRENLQTMGVALGDPARAGIEDRLVAYAGALGSVGVTSIRTLGRGAFPQLAYSWDGLLPLDLVAERQPGYFATLEFGEPWRQIAATYRLVRQAMGQQ